MKLAPFSANRQQSLQSRVHSSDGYTHTAYRHWSLATIREWSWGDGERAISICAAATHVTAAVCIMKRLEYRPHFVLTICQCSHQKTSRRHLLASLAESDYCWLLSHSLLAETVFADTSVQWMNTDRYTISVYLYMLVQLHSAVPYRKRYSISVNQKRER